MRNMLKEREKKGLGRPKGDTMLAEFMEEEDLQGAITAKGCGADDPPSEISEQLLFCRKEETASAIPELLMHWSCTFTLSEYH